MQEENDDNVDSLESIDESININMLTGRSSRVYYYFSSIVTRLRKAYL